jgi:predicted dienelactone hydrolase
MPFSPSGERNGPPFAAGLSRITVDDAAADDTIRGAVWYPTAAPERAVAEGPWWFSVAPEAPPMTDRFPLVLVSHGTSGWWGGHHDTAENLARHGFVVASLSHPQDNHTDANGFGAAARFVDRPRHVATVLDAVLGMPAFAPIIDPDRVGVVGYSAGGYTAIVLAGGRPDLGKLLTHPADDPPDIYFGLPGLRERQKSLPRRPAFVHEPRIRSVFVMAPALGFLFDSVGLAQVRVPVRLYRAEHEEVLRHPYDGETYRRLLPAEPEFVVVEGAGHYAFLAPAPDSLAAELPELFVDRSGFDRRAFHRRLNSEAVAFFGRTLAVD